MQATATPYGVQGHGKLPTHPAGEWKTDEIQPLTRQSFLDLLAGKVPVIKIPGFATKDVCEKLLAELTPKFCPYMNTVGPVLEKVGLAQFEFQAQADEDYGKRSGDGEMLLSPDVFLPLSSFVAVDRSETDTSHREKKVLRRSGQIPVHA